MAQLECSIVSPVKKVYEGKARYIKAPGRIGEFGVLAGHEDFITILDPGILSLEIDEEGVDEYFVTGGYFEVTEDNVIVIADEIYKREEINRDEALKKAEELKQAIEEKGFSDPEYEKLKYQYEKYSKMADFAS